MIKKAVIILSGLEAKTLSLGRMISPEFWLLKNKPLIEWLVDEVLAIGAEEIVFIGTEEKKKVLDYFRPGLRSEKDLNENASSGTSYEKVTFSFILGRDILDIVPSKIKNRIWGEPVALIEANSFLGDSVNSFEQLWHLFKTTGQTTIGLSIEKDISEEGLLAEKIADRIYKVKEIKIEEGLDVPGFGMAGRIIIGSDFWEALTDFKKEYKLDEMSFRQTLSMMITGGKTIYGYEIGGVRFDLNKASGWQDAAYYLIDQDHD